jgi:hypothetical protein
VYLSKVVYQMEEIDTVILTRIRRFSREHVRIGVCRTEDASATARNLYMKRQKDGKTL